MIFPAECLDWLPILCFFSFWLIDLSEELLTALQMKSKLGVSMCSEICFQLLFFAS